MNKNIKSIDEFKMISDYMGRIGKVGGSSKSEKKLKALELNRQKWSKIAKERKHAKSK